MHNALNRAIQRFRNLPLQAKGLVVVAIPLAGLILVLFSFYMVQRADQTAGQALMRAFEVRAETQALHTQIQECESSVMGYLLTGDPSWLVTYRENRRELPEMVSVLERMVEGNPAEVARAQKIKSLIMRRRDVLDSLLSRLPPLSGWHPALAESSSAVEQIDAELHGMQQEENRLLEQRRAHARAVTMSGYYVVAGGLLIVPAAAIVAMLLFASAIARRLTGGADPAFAHGRTIDHADDRGAALAQRDQRSEQRPSGDEHDVHADEVPQMDGSALPDANEPYPQRPAGGGCDRGRPGRG
jgi:CHASE3 domain sensor protein